MVSEGTWHRVSDGIEAPTADSLPAQLWRVCHCFPGDTAIVRQLSGDRTVFITFKQLLVASWQLKQRLSNLGIRAGAGDVVAVVAERQCPLAVIIFAIWLSGAIYFPVGDSSHCNSVDMTVRIQECGAKCLITDRPLAGLGDMAVLDVRGLLVSDFPADFELEPSLNDMEAPGVCLDSIAYIVSSSGSTGSPKLISISHRALQAFYSGHQASDIAFLKGDRVVQSASLQSDVHLLESVVALAAGAALLPIAESLLLNSAALFGYCERLEASYMYSVPSVWTHHLKTVSELPGCLRVVRVGGERIPHSLVEKLRVAKSPHTRLLASYGPAECTISAACCDLDRDSLDVNQCPIGRPLPSHSFRLAGGESDDGEASELLIAGPCLMRGYVHGDGESTPFVRVEGDFRDWYPTGDLCTRRGEMFYFVGRSDAVIKVNGLKADLHAIEELMAGYPSAAVWHPQKQLIAVFVVCGEGDLPSLRELVAAQLPRHMLPTRMVRVDSLPLNSSFKVDRQRLLQWLDSNVDSPGSGCVAAEAGSNSSALQQRVYNEWLLVLGLSRESLAMNVDQSFFAAGGNSLTAALLSQRLGMPLTAIYDNPTLRSMAEWLQSHEPCSLLLRESSLVPSPNQEDSIASFQQTAIFHHSALTGNGYVLPFSWQLPSDVSPQRVEAVINSCPELRMAFSVRDDGELYQRVTWRRVTVGRQRCEASEFSDWSRRWVVDHQSLLSLDSGVLIMAVLVDIIDSSRTEGEGQGCRQQLLGIAHHIATDGLGLELLRKRILRGDDRVRVPSYVDYAVWQRSVIPRQFPGRPELVGVDYHSLNLPLGDMSRAVFPTRTFAEPWPAKVSCWLDGIPRQDHFIHLSYFLVLALRAVTVTGPDDKLVISSTVGNHWLDTVGCMFCDVYYCHEKAMSLREWRDHVLFVQSHAELIPDYLLDDQLIGHPESFLYITPYAVTWEDDWWQSSDLSIGSSDEDLPGVQISLSREGMTLRYHASDRLWNTIWEEYLRIAISFIHD